MSQLQRLAGLLSQGHLEPRRLADGTGVIVDLEGMRVLTLNRTALFIVEALAGGVSSAEDIVERLVSKFEVEPPQARRDLEEFLAEVEATFGPSRA